MGLSEDGGEFFEGDELDGHLQGGFEFLYHQFSGSEVAGGDGDEDAGTTAEPPVNFGEEEFAGLGEGAALGEEVVEALLDQFVGIGVFFEDGRSQTRAAFVALGFDVNSRPGLGFHEAGVFELAIDFADGVAVQAGDLGELAGTGESMSGGILTGCDRKLDLVEQLPRSRNIAIRLNVKLHRISHRTVEK